MELRCKNRTIRPVSRRESRGQAGAASIGRSKPVLEQRARPKGTRSRVSVRRYRVSPSAATVPRTREETRAKETNEEEEEGAGIGGKGGGAAGRAREQCLASGWWGVYSFRCQPVDYSDDPMALRMARGCWWYYFSKFTEFMDTVFFVLRKKNNHISTLHVIHHGCMPMSVWFGVKFTPGGHSSFFGLLNTFVHIVMYSYYLLAALGPRIQPYLWWKKYLTSLQMIQFVLVMIHAFQLLFVDCNYPKAFVWLIGMHAVMFYFLFRDFYIEAYKKRKSKIRKRQEEARKKEEEESMDESSRNRIKENDLIYANQYKMATGYISDEGLRNRVFIDNRGLSDE
ncbi:elongation of very long chain fatty acids protein AAEL008004-like [Vespula squamosa]|uniref:Elongation of very long chain fatty acids protein n=1 Tax=Vespula squamosa TaxID=30214 RepID=A0ABD2AWP4_VESSQ